MKLRIRQFMAVLLALALALGLAACKKDDGGETENLVFQYAPNYIAEDVPLPVDTGVLEGSCTDGETMWFPPESEAQPALCRVPLSAGEAEILADYWLPEVDEDTIVGYLGPILGGDGKLWMWEQFIQYEYDLPEGFDPGTDNKGDYITGTVQTWQMRQLDPASGRELSTVDITAAMEQIDGMVLCGMAVDQDGYVYLADPEQVAVTSGQGQFLFTLEGDLPANSMSSGSAGGRWPCCPMGGPRLSSPGPAGCGRCGPLIPRRRTGGRLPARCPPAAGFTAARGTASFTICGTAYSTAWRRGRSCPNTCCPGATPSWMRAAAYSASPCWRRAGRRC